MAQLIHIAGPKDETSLGDVVFVHGLGGDARTTWTNRGGESWIEWLAEELPDLAFWSYGYDAAPSALLGSPMILPDRATNALATLKAARVGEKGIVFVAHSMGGLLVKEMLREAETSAPEYHAIASSSRLVVFLSTPHTGSDIPKYLATLDRALRLPLLPRWLQLLRFLVRPTKSVRELERDHASLRQLALWYRANAPLLGVGTVSLYEVKKTYGLLVVPPSSADPGIAGSTPIPEDADHFEIAKPENKDSLVFTTTRNNLQKLFLPKAHPPAHTRPVTQTTTTSSTWPPARLADARVVSRHLPLLTGTLALMAVGIVFLYDHAPLPVDVDVPVAGVPVAGEEPQPPIADTECQGLETRARVETQGLEWQDDCSLRDQERWWGRTVTLSTWGMNLQYADRTITRAVLVPPNRPYIFPRRSALFAGYSTRDGAWWAYTTRNPRAPKPEDLPIVRPN